MLLFCGIPSEPPLRLAIDAAEQTGIDYAIFNQRESLFSDITFDLDRGVVSGVLRLRETNYPLNAFKGIYSRLMDWNALPENCPSMHSQPDPRKVERSRLVHEALNIWLEMAQCRVLNKTSSTSSNLSKPYQAQFIVRSGFSTPPTLITNDIDELHAFMGVHRRVVYKSTSSIRSIVQELRQSDFEHLHKLRNLPTQFQAYIPGTNVRVHVVGEQVFATQIESDAVDYRYASQDGIDVVMQAIELPRDVHNKCLNLSKILKLPLCGIDLKFTPEGEVYCFEVNPSPAYSCYEQYTGQPISVAIVHYLAGDEDESAG